MTSDQVVCPWCGEEMRFDADSVHVWYKCDNCFAISPKAIRVWDKDKSNQENWLKNKANALLAIQKSKLKLLRWISVEKMLPPLGEVLICTRGNYVTVAWFHANGKFETGGGLMLDTKFVSHWMHLPEAPEEDAK